MIYNRREIMKQAWREAKSAIANMGYAPSQLRELFAYHLRLAWAAAKKAIRFAKLSAQEIGHQIMSLECKERLSAANYKELDVLKDFQRQAWKREAASIKLAA